MKLFEHFHSFKLTTKFVLSVSAMLLISMTVTSIYMTQGQAESYRRELLTKGETMIHILSVNAESGVIFESKYELKELLSVLNNFSDFKYANVTNNKGIILTSLGEWDERDVEKSSRINSHDFRHANCHQYYIELNNGEEFIELNTPVISRKEKRSRETLGMTGSNKSSGSKEYTTEVIGSIKLILSQKSVNEAIAASRRGSIFTAIIVLVLSILVLIALIRVITKPVGMLVEVTDKVSRGDLTQEVNISQKDEIGHLAKTFNRMIKSLRQSRDEIEEYNRNLEDKIVERTIALKEAQSHLIQSEKMGAIGQLAAGVAHELNNPLGGILGYAQFTLEKMRKESAEEDKNNNIEGYIRYISYIETQVKRCKAIVQNLLRFSRSSSTDEVGKVDPNKTVKDTITFVEHQLRMNKIAVKTDLTPEMPEIQANEGQIQQVLTNLIINAMHASSHGSEIAIATSYSPPVGEFKGTVEFKVSDKGHGISPETMKKIFEPFFTTKEVGKGTGLGLSLSYGIITNHGGEINVDSTVGEGTTFTVILPIQRDLVSDDNTAGKIFSS
ncbi:MAG: ATP-binding protein [candidate division Zixibacteria bacterium]|nr:ATP-binding protein [candidate division Zixibacteria bacterium]